ncbi:hypothetical protein [Sphingobacterium sp. LRF_L2]|uniref:hypothetical protein n=1 Tax=Sphingobacterium sp. LRF_L2 TaxID=3369421 RepID=UPI003F601E04
MKTTPSSAKQNAMIGYQINRLGLDTETKEELIYLYTDGRTTRIRDLHSNEASQVIQALTTGRAYVVTKSQKMRRKILSMAHEMGWKLDNGKIDMDSVNRWCIGYGYLSKPLDEYREHELPDLVTAFTKMYLKHLKGI